jgi:uncharacterized protein
MVKEFEISVRPIDAASLPSLKKVVCRHLSIQSDELSGLEIVRRSVDARRSPVWIRMKIRVYTHPYQPLTAAEPVHFRDVRQAPAVVIAGAGPAGLFAALRLIEKGLKPVIVERGKNVSDRKTDIARLNREHKVNPDSNYCFGEGGAGTFSDGKLYTRSTKRGNVDAVLRMMVQHGASEDILIDTHPHIGSDRLLPMITAIRNTILDHGGEIHFGHRIADIEYRGNRTTAFIDSLGNRFEGIAFILATGHSARDIYRLFDSKGWPLEAKPFALGVRAEHPQYLINTIQYHQKNPDPYLPAATYTLTARSQDKGVFSFCMCPGGIMVPSATGQDHLVVNGMSNSRRNSPFANAGIVTEIGMDDFSRYAHLGSLAALAYQEDVERQMLVGGMFSQRAPAQRLTDFIARRLSDDLPASSYFPGLQSAPLHELLPSPVSVRLKEGFLQFEKKMKGYITRDAIITGTESRTSSPVRIPRNPENMQYPLFENLYPCGEGAGYAGGIVSSAIDGENAAKMILTKNGLL